jgi:hypothetical protein
MADDCCASACGSETAKADPRWRRILWIALIVQRGNVLGRNGGGRGSGQPSAASRRAGFPGRCGQLCGEPRRGRCWRSLGARAPLCSNRCSCWASRPGCSAAAVLAFVNGACARIRRRWGRSALVALAANAGVALHAVSLPDRRRQYAARSGYARATTRSAMSAVMLAALGVFGTGSAWPDLFVASIMALLALTGGVQVLRQARGELRTPETGGAVVTSCFKPSPFCRSSPSSPRHYCARLPSGDAPVTAPLPSCLPLGFNASPESVSL